MHFYGHPYLDVAGAGFEPATSWLCILATIFIAFDRVSKFVVRTIPYCFKQFCHLVSTHFLIFQLGLARDYLSATLAEGASPNLANYLSESCLSERPNSQKYELMVYYQYVKVINAQ